MKKPNHSHTTEGPPCRHMEVFLQQAADGSAKPWVRWYALAHAARCYRCGNYLARLGETIRVLRRRRDEDVPDVLVERVMQGSWREPPSKS